MPKVVSILLILLASQAEAAGPRCDGTAAAKAARERLAKGELVQALAEAEAAVKACPAPVTQLALADVLAEAWLRDKAAAAYRKAMVGATPEEKETAKRGLEALKGAGPTPSIQDLIREGNWQRVVAFAEARRLAMTPFVWSGHGAGVDAVAWGGKTIATGARDRTIKLWDESGRGLMTLTGHVDRVAALAFSADARFLASAAADRTVRIWDVASGRELRSIVAHDNVVSAVAFAPDGKRVASGGWDAKVKIWDVDTGRQMALLAANDSIVRIAWSRDGARLATVARDGGLALWDASGAAQKTKLPADKVLDAVFLPDGSLVVSQEDGVRRFDAAGKALKRYAMQPAPRVFADEAGGTIAILAGDLSIVDVAKGTILRTISGLGGATIAAVAPDLSRVAVARDEAFVRSSASTARVALGSLGRPIRALGWVGTTLVAGGGQSWFSWGMAAPPARGQGQLVAVGGSDLAFRTAGLVELADLGGSVKRSQPASCPAPVVALKPTGDPIIACRDAEREPRALAITPDGTQSVGVAVVRASSVARPAGELAAGPVGGPPRATKRVPVEDSAVAVSKTGVVATGGRELTLWRLASLQKLRVLAPTSSPTTALGFTPDGKLLASGHLDGTIAFWEVATGRRRGILVVGDDGRWQYTAEDGHSAGDGDFVSLAVAGAVTPPGITRARVPQLSPLAR